MKFSAVIVAGGSGRRMGGETPKQWRPLAGRPLALWSVEALLAAGAQEIAFVASTDDQDRARALFERLPTVRLAVGGAERMDSVRSGLRALAPLPDAVLIHDAARPLLSREIIDGLLDGLRSAEGAIPALAVSDTLKRSHGAGLVEGTVDRAHLYRAQTPQAFRSQALLEAFAAWPSDRVPTDDAAVLEQWGGRVRLTPGDPRLMKATFQEDWPMLEAMAGAARLTRAGQGFDAHRFGPGEGVWLCGVLIPHHQSLVGHSDADAGLHALTDALLGAIGEGDIGDHFPPSDPLWKGAASDLFLKHADALIRHRGGRVVNVDVTIICERPKIKPHRQAMRERLADILSLPLDRVSVKATTTEGMGFAGREEGVAASAIVSVETPA